MPQSTTTTERTQSPRHTDLSGMHRITDHDDAVEELFTDLALQEGEYQSTITDVRVGIKRNTWGEGFERDDGNTRPDPLGGWLYNPDTDTINECLGKWDDYNKAQCTHLGYGDNIYIGVEVPDRNPQYIRLQSLDHVQTHRGVSELLADLIDTYGHLSNLVGKPLLISDIETNRATIEHPGTGASINMPLTTLSSDSDVEYLSDEEALTDATGAIRYMATRPSQGNPWVSAECELYIDDGADTAALTTDVEGVTRVFKFPVTMDEGTLFRFIVDELGNGTPADLSATVEVAFARDTLITRETLLNHVYSQETLAIDTTGCWVLRNPRKETHNTTVTETATSAADSLFTRLKNRF